MAISRREILSTTLVSLTAAHAGSLAVGTIKEPGVAIWPPNLHLPIWPGLPPGATETAPRHRAKMGEGSLLQLRGIAVPELHIFPAARPDGRALLVLPGGAYSFLSVTNEGLDVANAFAPRGMTVFVLAYRLPGEGWHGKSDVPLQDAQRAMRLVRAHAGRWGIDPEKTGVIGFSAGGHLAGTLATAFDDRAYSAVDLTDRQSARPAFAGLIYPIITMSLPVTHSDSRENLLGKNPSASLVSSRSVELHMNEVTPPQFLLHALDDPVVPPENSFLALAAARSAKVAVEAHLIEMGSHGFAFSLPNENPGAYWPSLFDAWSKTHV